MLKDGFKLITQIKSKAGYHLKVKVQIPKQSQLRYIISAACFGSIPGCPPSWICLEISKGTCQGGILIRCPKHLNWLLAKQRSFGSRLVPKSEPRPSEGSSVWLLVSTMSFFWSLPRAHDQRWWMKCMSTGKYSGYQCQLLLHCNGLVQKTCITVDAACHSPAPS